MTSNIRIVLSKQINMYLRIIISFLLFFPVFISAQEIDHWESVVINTDLWKYSLGTDTISSNWMMPDYETDNWEIGIGGFGYGDMDDNTLLLNAKSVFIRRKFNITNVTNINTVILQADYDDGFVAYLNGVEIARKNIGHPGEITKYNASADSAIEPFLIQNLQPESFFIPTTNLLQGSNTLAIQTHNYGDASSDLSSNYFLTLGISSEEYLYNDPPSWFQPPIIIENDFDSNLPIIKISTIYNSEIPDEPKISAHMGIIYNGVDSLNNSNDFFNEYDGSIGIELRGTSSLIFDKKGFGIETRNEDGSNNNVSLLGMPEENDWVLHGPYSDKSLMRNALAYYLGSLTGEYAPRTRFCELFINQNYLGIYLLIEKIKRNKERVDIAKLTPEENEGDDLTGGYIIKVDRNDQNIPDIGWYSTFPTNKFFAYVEPKSSKITDPQKKYIRDYMFTFEEAMSKSNYKDTYLNYIDIDSWINYFIVTEITKQIDAYKLSFYMYKDKDSNGGKLHLGPLWDFNFGFGNFDFECLPTPNGWAYEFPDCGNWHPFWARKIFDIPEVQDRINCRWNELRSNEFSIINIFDYINKNASLLKEASERNFSKWPILGQYVWGNDFYGNTYEEEIGFLKNWTGQRLTWLDDNMVGDCSSVISSVHEAEFAPIKIHPNPASEKITISLIETKQAVTSIIISDMLGKLILKKAINNSPLSVNVSDFTQGAYIITLYSDGKTLGKSTFIKS